MAPPPRNDTADTGAPTPGTAAWDLLPAAKQQQIMDAAVDEFAARGYSGASMNALVKAAGISKGSLFHYFRTKGGLFEGIVDTAFGQVKARVKAVRDDTAGRPLPERLEQLLATGFDFVSEHPRLAGIYFRVLRSGDAPFGLGRVEELGRHSRRFLAELITQARDAGEIDPVVDVERTAWLIDAMMERLLSAWHDGGLAAGDRPEQRDAERRAWTAAFGAFVRRGLTPSAKEGDHV
jgi:TetR/AcrR family transcriptional regulator